MTEALLTLFMVLVVFFWLTATFRRGVMRMLKGKHIMLTDNGPGAWTLTWATLWLAHFSPDWTERYGSTWAVGDETNVLYYTPKGTADGH